jgi:hypothetical protein
MILGPDPKLESIYIQLYEKADALFQEYDICGTGVGDGKCFGNRKVFSGRGPDRCCKGCQHLGPEKVCQVISLYCKLWICGSVVVAAQHDPVLMAHVKKLNSMFHEARHAGIIIGQHAHGLVDSTGIGFRCGKAETLEQIRQFNERKESLK